MDAYKLLCHRIVRLTSILSPSVSRSPPLEYLLVPPCGIVPFNRTHLPPLPLPPSLPTSPLIMATTGAISSAGSGIAGLLRLPRKATRDPAFAAHATARPAGSVTDGGNLIWGRQLRPALLHLDKSSPPTRRVLLRPVAAAASSSPAEGGDSVG